MGRLWLMFIATLAACGRVGFDERTTSDATSPGDGSNDGSPDAPPGTGVAFVGSPLQHTGTMGSTDSATLQATSAGDAIALVVACDGATIPSSVTIAAPGWTFTPLAPLTINVSGQVYAASYGAIAPNTNAATLTVTWANTNCNRGQSMLADEFARVDPTGGTTTFDAHSAAMGAGNCTTTITTQHDGDAIWGACYTANQLTGPGAGYTKSAADTVGDFAEYKLPNDPANTSETVTFGNSAGYVVVATTIKPLP